MALVVEDGTGLSDAQTYATVDYIKTYTRTRGISFPTANNEIERLLILAMDALRGLDYKGERATREQALDWPRIDVEIDGYEYASTEIPRELIELQCIYAIELYKGVDLLPTVSGNTSGPIIGRTVEGISTQYAESGRANIRPIVERARPLLRKLLRGGGGENTIRLIRA